MALSIIFFLVIIMGLGSVARQAGFKKENLLEKTIISAGIGLSLIPFLGVIFNHLSIPLDYKSFIGTACIFLFISTFRFFKKKQKISFPKTNDLFSAQDLIALLIFAISLFMYLKGSFAYSWLENSDPWRYLPAIKYIEVEKTYTTLFKFNELALPHPQGYQILMAILSQINNSLNWTLKFFNSFIAAFSLLFFYFLANKMLKNKNSALLSTAALASMPAWLSHFIFAMNLNVMLLPLLLYSLHKTTHNKKWIMPSALIFASIWCTHFYSSFVTTLLLIIYYPVTVLCRNNLQKRVIASILLGLGLAAAFFWIPYCFVQFSNSFPGGSNLIFPPLLELAKNWIFLSTITVMLLIITFFYFTDKFWIPKLIKVLKKHKIRYLKQIFFYFGLTAFLGLLLIPEKRMALLGSGSIPYTWQHFFCLMPRRNLIQNPFGIGPLTLTIAIIAFFYLISKSKHLFTRRFTQQTLIFTFTIFSFLAVNSGRLSVNLMPFRMWQFFAFSTALLNGVFYNELIAKKIKKSWNKILIIVIIIFLFIPSWYYNKFKLNTSIWNENYLGVIQSRESYAWIKDNLPKNSKVYSLGVTQAIPLGYDMISFAWNLKVKNYKDNDVSINPDQNYQFLKQNSYEYIIIDYPSIFTYTFNRSHIYAGLPEKTRKNVALNRSKIALTKKQVFEKSDKFKMVKEFSHGAIFQIK
jgi:hypothetical protein